MSLTRRVQLLLDEERYARVAAIDAATGAPASTRQQAWATIVAAEPMDVPDTEDLRAEIDAAHERR